MTSPNHYLSRVTRKGGVGVTSPVRIHGEHLLHSKTELLWSSGSLGWTNTGIICGPVAHVSVAVLAIPV
jgi:hypothetical protein